MQRKPWYKRLQFFFPWSSPYLGIQWNNSFVGVTLRKPEEPC